MRIAVRNVTPANGPLYIPPVTEIDDRASRWITGVALFGHGVIWFVATALWALADKQ